MRVMMLGSHRAPIVSRLNRALVRRGLEVVMVSHDAEGFEGVEDLGPLRGYQDYLKCVSRVGSLVKRYKPDLIHAHKANHYGLTAALLNKAPYLLALWGSEITVAPDTGSAAKRWIYRKILKKAIGRASLCHSSSRHVCERAAEISGQPEDRFRSWFWGVIPDTMWHPPAPEVAARLEKEFGLGERIILSGRGVAPIYRPQLVAEVIKAVGRENLEIGGKFVVLRGFSTDAQVAEFLGALRGYEENFCFVDRLLDEEELACLYNKCLAHLSLPVADSLGAGVIEPAMAGSFPVLSDIPGNVTFAKDNFGSICITGSNIEADAHNVVNVLKNAEFLQKSSMAKVDRLKSNYGEDRIAENFISIYSEALGDFAR